MDSHALLGRLQQTGRVRSPEATAVPLTGPNQSRLVLPQRAHAKWNELLRIQRELGARARFTGSRIYDQILTVPNLIL